MSKLEQLIKELCPDGVEWKKIGEICEITRGVVISKDDIRNNIGEYPVYSSQTENNGELGRISTYAYNGEYLTWTTDGANAGTVFYRTGKFNVTNVCGLLKIRSSDNLTKYIYHILRVEAYKYVRSGMGNPKLMSNVMANIQIPLPPLPVQEEIVRILDTFTELTTELTAELTMRKQQYEYYRDSLLTFGEEVEWRTISDIGELVRGNGLPKADFTESGVPAIHYGQIYTYYGNSTVETKSFVSYETAQKLKKVNYGDVIITNTSENLKDVGKALLYLGTEQAVTGGHATIFKPSNIILGKFFVYITQSLNFEKQKVKFAKGTKVIDVSANDMSKILIPLPPLEEQQRIVDILDRFDTFVNDIKTGLPAEIEARQKQYEYYRDKLLTFKKLEREV